MPPKTRQAAVAAQPTPAAPLYIEHPLVPGAAPRRMEVRLPSHEQIAVWQSVGQRFKDMGAQWAYEREQLGDVAADDPAVVEFEARRNTQALKGIGRAMKLIRSILVDPEDYDRVEDAMMEGATLEYSLTIVSKAVAAMRARAVQGNVNASAALGAQIAAKLVAD